MVWGRVTAMCRWLFRLFLGSKQTLVNNDPAQIVKEQNGVRANCQVTNEAEQKNLQTSPKLLTLENRKLWGKGKCKACSRAERRANSLWCPLLFVVPMSAVLKVPSGAWGKRGESSDIISAAFVCSIHRHITPLSVFFVVFSYIFSLHDLFTSFFSSFYCS